MIYLNDRVFRWLTVALLMPGLDACKPEEAKPGEKPSAQQVSVVTIHRQPVSLTTVWPGRTSAYRISEVRPQVSGLILKRLFAEGDNVKEGQQLYQIDPQPYEAALNSAKASLRKAQATVTSAQLTVARDRALVQAMAVSKQTLDNDVATLQQAEADVGSARASVDTANINLAYTKVYSPISGRSGRSSVTEGALVTASQTTSLVTITQLDPIYVDVTQPTTTLLRFKREQLSGKLKGTGIDQIAVDLILEDGGDYGHVGKFQFSEVNVDQATGSVTIRAIFPNAEGLLLPGMFVRERIEEGVDENGMLVPQQAVTHNAQGQPTSLVVSPDNKVESRVLIADRAIGHDWLVTGGLAEGDRVITEGVQKVRPGMTVVVQDITRPVRSAEQAAGTSRPALAKN